MKNIESRPNRDLFPELMEGVQEMKRHREGKITLRSYRIPLLQVSVDADFIRETREKLNVSRSVFARSLGIHPRTLEKWEQRRARPNPQAALWLRLVHQHPETLQHLDVILTGGEAVPAS